MKGFVQDIEDLAVKNDEFRRVLHTARHCQLVVMALEPKEEIGVDTRVDAEADDEHFDGKTTE
jgi:hypothetical protein